MTSYIIGHILKSYEREILRRLIRKKIGVVFSILDSGRVNLEARSKFQKFIVAPPVVGADQTQNLRILFLPYFYFKLKTV